MRRCSTCRWWRPESEDEGVCSYFMIPFWALVLEGAQRTLASEGEECQCWEGGVTNEVAGG